MHLYPALYIYMQCSSPIIIIFIVAYFCCTIHSIHFNPSLNEMRDFKCRLILFFSSKWGLTLR